MMRVAPGEPRLNAENDDDCDDYDNDDEAESEPHLTKEIYGDFDDYDDACNDDYDYDDDDSQSHR